MAQKTTLDAVDILQQHLAASVLFMDANSPNGNLVKVTRPLNSKKEDVVINALVLPNGTIQEGILNVNIYVPNLSLPTDPVDNSQPNWKRIKYLTALATEALEEVYGSDYNFELQQSVGPIADQGNQHYQNLRIHFIAINPF